MHTAARTREYIRNEDVARDENANWTATPRRHEWRGGDRELSQSLIFSKGIRRGMADDTANFVVDHSVRCYCRVVIIIAANDYDGERHR